MKIKSINEFKRKYLPKAYEQERLEKMTPEELGREMAEQSIRKAKEQADDR